MSNQLQTILPEDFGLPGPSGRYGSSKRRSSHLGQSLLKGIVMSVVRRAMVGLMATLAMPLFLVAAMWWVFPETVNAVTGILFGLDNVFNLNAWTEWSHEQLGYASGAVSDEVTGQSTGCTSCRETKS